VASVVGVLTRLGFGVAGWPDKRRSHEQTRAGIEAAFARLGAGLRESGVRTR